eukprot:scaffold47_cov258-Pinguiococcus_pyrenoidosus.AAC.50
MDGPEMYLPGAASLMESLDRRLLVSERVADWMRGSDAQFGGALGWTNADEAFPSRNFRGVVSYCAMGGTLLGSCGPTISLQIWSWRFVSKAL